MLKALLTASLVVATAAPALAQKEIPKAEGHDQCPLGYVNTFGTTCVSPIYYEVAPTNGEACQSMVTVTPRTLARSQKVG